MLAVAVQQRLAVGGETDVAERQLNDADSLATLATQSDPKWADPLVERARVASGEELVAAELRITLDEIGQIAGETYTDDILDRVFSRFCIGK